MKTIISAESIKAISSQHRTGLVIEIEMTEQQMFNALNQFLHFVTDETWTRWQAEINGEVYAKDESWALRNNVLKG